MVLGELHQDGEDAAHRGDRSGAEDSGVAVVSAGMGTGQMDSVGIENLDIDLVPWKDGDLDDEKISSRDLMVPSLGALRHLLVWIVLYWACPFLLMLLAVDLEWVVSHRRMSQSGQDRLLGQPDRVQLQWNSLVEATSFQSYPCSPRMILWPPYFYVADVQLGLGLLGEEDPCGFAADCFGSPQKPSHAGDVVAVFQVL